MGNSVGVLAILDELLAFASRGVEREDPGRQLIESGYESRVAVEELLIAMAVFTRCAYPCDTSIDPRGYSWCEAYLDEALPIAKSAFARCKLVQYPIPKV